MNAAKRRLRRKMLIQLLEENQKKGIKPVIGHGLSGKTFDIDDYASIPDLVDALLKQSDLSHRQLGI